MTGGVWTSSTPSGTPADPPSNAKGNSSHGRNSKQTMASQAGLSLERPQQAEGFEMGAPMSMAEDLVKRLRTHMVVHTTDLGDYGTHSTGYVDPDCEAAADLIEQQSATIAAKDEEIERLRAADPRTSLLTVIADIREKTGLGGKPMLNELADAIVAEMDRRATDEREKMLDKVCENLIVLSRGDESIIGAARVALNNAAVFICGADRAKRAIRSGGGE